MNIESKKPSTYLLILLIGFLLGTSISYLYNNPKSVKTKEYWENNNFKPDTVFISKPYKLPKLRNHQYIPPKEVIIYLHDTIDPFKIELHGDSLLSIIDTTTDSTTLIDKAFLTEFRNNPKLIRGYFTIDTITLDLLKTNGEAYTETFLTNYSRFNYHFYEEGMYTTEVPKKSTSNKLLKTSLYLFAGYEPLTKKPLITTDGFLGIKKLTLGISPTIFISSQPTLQIQLKAGYQIK